MELENRMKATIVLGVIIAAFLQGCSSDKASLQMETLYQDAVDYVLRQDLKDRGVIELSEEHAAMSKDNLAHVVKSNGNTAILFKTWIGKGRNMKGYLYTANPLSKGALQTDYYGNHVFPFDEIDVVVGEQIDKHWCKVSYQLD